MIEDAVVTVYKDNKPVTNNEKPDEHVDDHKRIVRRGRFKFSMVDIKIGECITFMPTNTEVKVASDDSIEYEGLFTSFLLLSVLSCLKTREIHPELIKVQNTFRIKGKCWIICVTQ